MNFVDPALLGMNVLENAATLGVRPEHLSLVASGAGTLEGTVAFCEALGADTLVHVRLKDKSTIVARTTGNPLDVDKPVGVMVTPEAIVSFDEMGRRL